MKTKPLTLIFLSTFILSVLYAVPSKINYQGLITDGSGSPIVSETNTIITNLYATALDEAILYSESFTDVVSNDDGIYSIQIGDSNLQTLLEANSDLWLELTINGETLSPRQYINAVPYALVAKAAKSIVPGSDLDLLIANNTNAITAETAARISALGSLQNEVSEAEADALLTLSTEISNRINSIAALQTDVDQNESDADAAILALQISQASSARQFVVDFGFSDNQSNLESIYLDLYNHETNGAYSCEVGDLVLLTGQTDLSENGIYEITSSSYGTWDKYISLARPLNYDSSGEVNEGDFALVEKGSLSGVAFMLGELSETFELGIDDLNWYRCGINTTADLEFQGTVTFSEIRNNPSFNGAEFRLGEYDNYLRMDGGASFDFEGYGGRVRFQDGIEVDFQNSGGVDFHTDVDFDSTVTVQNPTLDNHVANKVYVDSQVATNTTLISSEITNRSSAIASIQADVDQNELDADTAIAALVADVDQNELDVDTAIAALVADVDQNELDVDTAIASLQADVDQNELEADAAIMSLQAADAARPSQTPVLLATEWNEPNLNGVYIQYWDGAQWSHMGIGDRILIAAQGSASENGIYEVASVSGNYGSLVRAEDYDTAEEINAGDFIFVQAGQLAGQGYVLGALSESFELGVDALNFSRFTIDTTQDVEFQQQVTVQELRINNGPSGTVDFNGFSNYIGGDLYVNGYRADFEQLEEVLVPTPDHDNEAANKSYVDSVAVPPGGLIAWPSDQPIPAGYSNGHLTHDGMQYPAVDFIWILKD